MLSVRKCRGKDYHDSTFANRKLMANEIKFNFTVRIVIFVHNNMQMSDTLKPRTAENDMSMDVDVVANTFQKRWFLV
jgi:hypothetical protein